MTPLQREELDLDMKHIDDPWKPLNRREMQTRNDRIAERILRWISVSIMVAIAVIVGAEILFYAMAWFQ